MRSILFISNAYPDFENSYRGIFIKKMATLLQKEGYRISVVTPKIYKGSRYSENQDGIKVYRFPFFARNKLLIEHKTIPLLRMVIYYLTGFITSIYASIKNKSDLIHIHWAIPTGLIGTWVGSILGKPLVVTIHGSDLRMAMEKSGVIRKIFIYVCRRAGRLNCVSQEQKKEMISLGFEREQISVIPMGVDEAFLESGKNRKDKDNRKPFTILSNRNLLPIYNVSLLIRAIPIVLKEEPETTFLIAGEGPEKINLKSEVESLNGGSSVRFLGRVPHQEMPHLLSHSDIYVSTSFYDGTSVSLLEALASGAFPIVTDIPSNREWIVNGENGFLVPPEEERTLANKIIEAIRNQSLINTALGINLDIVEKRGYWKNNIKKVTSQYESIG
jgi:glycosyltransferase involved in cell wall biosynthesis